MKNVGVPVLIDGYTGPPVPSTGSDMTATEYLGYKSAKRECVSTGAAGARTHRSLRQHLLHLLILRLLVLCAPANFETQTAPANSNS